MAFRKPRNASAAAVESFPFKRINSRPSLHAIKDSTLSLSCRSEPFPLADLLLHWHLSGRDDLKVEVIRCGCAAFGPVVEDGPGGTKISHEIEEIFDMVSDALLAVIQTGKGEMRGENGHGVAEDEVFAR